MPSYFLSLDLVVELGMDYEAIVIQI